MYVFLVHICDVYEAMCAKRPYKLPMPREQVREFIQSKTGTMFDPELVRKFLDVVPAYLVGEELSVNTAVPPTYQCHVR